MPRASVLGLDVERRNARLATVWEFLRGSLWFVPACFVTIVVAVQWAAEHADRAGWSADVPTLRFVDNADSASTVLTTIATSMLTFVGVVFSITIVALQLVSQQFSPRVLRTFLRDIVTQATLAAFVATFVYALLVLRTVEPARGDEPEFVPYLSLAIAIWWVWAALVWFIVFMTHTTRSMRVSSIIDHVAQEGRRAIDQNIPAEVIGVEIPEPDLGEPTAVLPYPGRPRVLGGLETDRLVRLAQAHDTVLVLRLNVGEFLSTGQPMVEVHGGTPPEPHDILSSLETGTSRTMYQDVAFAIRQLVDIANKALSPAVNDPTTATQAIDQITDLLRHVAERPQPPCHYLDEAGALRLIRHVPTWDEYLDLAYTEIRRSGATQVQICRRLAAAFDDLSMCATPDHQARLDLHRALLATSVAAAFPDPTERKLAMVPDRQGLG